MANALVSNGSQAINRIAWVGTCNSVAQRLGNRVMNCNFVLLPVLAIAVLSFSAEANDGLVEPKVRMKTNHGDIVIELDGQKAPETVRNFLRYVGEKHYDGTVFHRVIDGFMVQGGGFRLDEGRIIEKKTTGQGIKNEGRNGLKNQRGTVAMARTADLDSARAQFFINVVDNPALDYPSNGGYAVFGKVVEGMDVVDKIKSVQTGVSKIAMLHPISGESMEMPSRDVPVEPVVIQTVEVVE